ncbi:MAG: 50S ribosomal protein L28 [Deltaproteobacteria bacterium]|nr:50S ribosomal protein L28 [Deltaproteobacteria bacterium]
MSLKCEICGKGASFGNSISHAHNKTRRRWNPNIQMIKVNLNGTVKKVRACTRCIRSRAVKKAA